MRFQAPTRAEVAPERFGHPIFTGYRRHLDWLTGADWPTLDALNSRLAQVDAKVRFVEQDAALLADGQHYETRIARHGHIATRARNWHDLLNALVWIEHAPLKHALNARQVADIGHVGDRTRTRGQYALTHFDEAGILVLLRDCDALAAWDRHDWLGLFVGHGDAWRENAIELVIFGHALLEHALWPNASLVGKGLAIDAGQWPLDTCLAALAQQIRSGQVLTDPQQLRPLPLLGVPGWHADAGQPAFYRQHASFQPLRAGRHYPPALAITGAPARHDSGAPG